MNNNKRGRVYNRIFSNEDWEIVNQENKDIIDDYILELKSTKKKESTVNQYYNDLRIVAIYILKKLDNKSLLELNKRHFRNMNLWLMDDLKLSSARCNRLMSATRSMLTYVEDSDEYDYDQNVASKVRGLPKEPVRDIVFLSDEQISKLRNRLKELKKYQHMLLLDLAYDSAGRRNELFQVKKEGLLERNNTNIVVGKRGKQFTLLYFDRTKESLELYLKERGEDDIESLWTIKKGESKKPASYESLYDWFIYMDKILSEIEEKPIGFNAHSFRHSALQNMKDGSHYVCKLLDKEDGFGIEQLAVFAHHSDISTTQSYLKSNDDEVLNDMFGIKIGD